MYIQSISYELAPNEISNQKIVDDFYAFGGSDDEDGPLQASQLYDQCWVNKRYASDEEQTAKDLGLSAAEKMFRESGVDRQEVDYLIFVSDALDYKGPTTACIMQHQLGLKQEIGAIDILHGCTGFIYGLNLAKALIHSGQSKKILLITADVPTKVIHPLDTDLRAIFSDAAAATLLSAEKDPNGINAEVGEFILGTDGSGEKVLRVERSGTRDPADSEWLEQHKAIPSGLRRGRLVMDSAKVLLFASRKVPSLVTDLLNKEGLNKSDISHYLLHQANGLMLDFIRKKMKVDKEEFIVNSQEVGNSVSASIPIALKLAMTHKPFKSGNKMVLAGFGIGLSWGATTLKF